MELDAALGIARADKRAVLVTIRQDGRPQLSNIFTSVDDEGIIRISITKDRAKTANIRRDPRVSLWVPGEDFFHYVVIEATAELTEVAAAPDDATVTELLAHYRLAMGEPDDVDEFRRSQVADGRLIARLTPTRVYGLWA